jgi:hypothetical protein
MTAAPARAYKPTESKYKGGAQELYVAYDETQATASGRPAAYPKVKRVYISGQVKSWKVGTFANRAGRQVHGVKIEFEQSRAGYTRKPFAAQRGSTKYKVAAAKVGGGHSQYSKIVEVPQGARNIHFYTGKLPARYQSARQRVR